VDIATAARELGISSEAVRQRLRRGGLVGRKQDNRWLIRLDRTPSEQPSERVETDDRTEPIDVSYRVRTDEEAAERLVERTSQKYVTDMRAITEQIDARYERLYREIIDAKEQMITEQAERITELKARLEALESQPEPRRPWWKWWG
jgi:BMFP domain-containing protein YqiC